MNRLVLLLISAAILFSCNKSSVVQGIDTSTATDSTPPVSKLQIKGRFRLQNVWKGTSLCISSGAIACLNTPTSYWQVQTIRDSAGFCLQDTVSRSYLVDNGSGKPILSTSYAGANAFWVFYNTGTGLTDSTFSPAVAYQMRNTRTGGYINIETGAVLSGSILPGWLSAQWQFLK
ncbi:MAG TPA: hypothetical protein VNW04_12240 [Puia sp.]|nr:hypothetical protein [Puia sp.]